jgi:hypothetical protein
MEIPPVLDNPLDDTPSPGIIGFGSAPASGSAQSAPDETAAGTVARVPGSNAGQVLPQAEPAASPRHGGWWMAAILLLLSGVVGLLTVRRFAHLT